MVTVLLCIERERERERLYACALCVCVVHVYNTHACAYKIIFEVMAFHTFMQS